MTMGVGRGVRHAEPDGPEAGRASAPAFTVAALTCSVSMRSVHLHTLLGATWVLTASGERALILRRGPHCTR